MTGPLLAAGILLVALITWLLRPRRRPMVEPWESDAVEAPDRTELARAEEAIRDRERIGEPEDEVPGDEWGPGAPRRS